MTSKGFCKNCGGPQEAHFVPDKDWPEGVCMCSMPDSPCGCPGFVLKEKGNGAHD